MIRLRRLQPQDADRMLEWMHDPDSVAHMHAPFASMTREDCLRFIASAAQDTPSVHRAAVDEADRYLGTVSLKNIEPDTRRAEFAIAMLAARDWTNREIAEHLKISANTVKSHISEAMKKLNVSARKELKQYMLQ